ncbi:hypothetical protein chiPu_0022434 [Chiloscyllium punctatum]|uniref:Uncharacterized protein n=1 Tax=Chiloscyllium punctatum TaxID=137246 RepID=A0A401REG0_CHIPU|nr:hypothetical protein [Chiloscyllium punctatum]
MLMSECQLGIAGGGVGLNGFSGAGGGGSVNNGSGSAQPPWNRSLERALEEAAATGVLSLSGRKLKEFPRSAANQDLTDTTQAGEIQRALTYTRLCCGDGSFGPTGIFRDVVNNVI